MIRKLGKYAIVEKLGEGAMGAVYKAYDEILDRYVAIKTMAEEIKWEPELKLRFYREARSVAALLHPNIVTIHDLGEEGKITYIVMELLQGKDLKTIIEEKTPLPLERKLSIMIQVADGLSHAHSRGIIHRDIKPGNIQVTPAWNVKIMDFGIARIPASDLTGSGIRLGTPIYMSPEQIKGAEMDARSDIFSAGIVFYEFLTYTHPFRDKNVVKTLDNILFQDKFAFSEQMPDAPARLWPILRSCLEKEPSRRCPSMAELASACRGLLEELNAASQHMEEEVKAALPLLRQASEHPDAPATLAQLLQSAHDLLGRKERPDYLTLKRFLKALAGEALMQVQVADTLSTRLPREEGAGVPGAQAPPSAPQMPETPPPVEIQPPPLAAEAVPPVKTTAATAPIQVDQAAAAEQERESIANALAKSDEALNRKDFAEAASYAQEALRFDPANSGAQQQLQRIAQSKERIRREEEAELLLIRAREALREKKLELAASQAEEALKVVPKHGAAMACLDQVRRAKESRARNVATAVAVAKQALIGGDLDNCENHARLALSLDPQSSEAKNLLEQVAQAREKNSQAQIADFLARGRDALGKQMFDQAKTFAGQALQLDSANPDAKLLLEEIERSRVIETSKGKEARKAEAPIAVLPSTAEQGKAGPIEETVVLKAAGTRRIPWLAIGLGAVFLILLGAGVGGGLYWKKMHARAAAQIPTQLAAAKTAFDQKMYDKAIALVQQVLVASPGNSQAQALLTEIQDKKKQLSVEVLLLEAQNLRTQNRFEESAQTIQKILEINPGYEPALAARAQLEADVSTTRSKEEQDKLVSAWLANASSLLSDNKLAEAKAELDKIARLRPDAPELPALRKRLTEMTAEAARQKEKLETAQKQTRIDTLRRRAEGLFKLGKYSEIPAVLDQWQKLAPQDSQLAALRAQAAEAMTALRAYEAAMAEKRYDEAIGALSRLEKVNPSDPALAELRRRSESSKAAAKAILTVLRMGEPAALTLDDQSVGGANGEIENKSIAIGRHKLAAKFGGGKQGSLIFEIGDGQNLTLVYDPLGAQVRHMVPADRELLAKRKIMEEVHSYPAEHRHGILGKCTGELLISGLKVEYKTSNKSHSFVIPFQGVTLAVNNERVELENKASKQSYTFKMRNAEEASAVQKLWEKLQQLSK